MQGAREIRYDLRDEGIFETRCVCLCTRVYFSFAALDGARVPVYTARRDNILVRWFVIFSGRVLCREVTYPYTKRKKIRREEKNLINKLYICVASEIKTFTALV